MIEVINKVPIRETNGIQSPSEGVSLEIKSHWSHKELIVMVIEGKKYSLSGNDLRAAIENALNAANPS